LAGGGYGEDMTLKRANQVGDDGVEKKTYWGKGRVGKFIL